MILTCGLPLPKSFNIIIFVDFIVAFGGILYSTILCCRLLKESYDPVYKVKPRVNKEEAGDTDNIISDSFDLEVKDDQPGDSGHTGVFIILAVTIFVLFLYFLLEVYLLRLGFRGSRAKNYIQCRRWFRSKLVIVVLGFMNFFRHAYISMMSDDEGLSMIAVSILLISSFYHIWKLVVASLFVESIKPENCPPTKQPQISV